MAQLVYIVGRSGVGKSTSIRKLNHEETVIINTDQKALPFKKFAEKYNDTKGNYKKTSKTSEIIEVLKQVHKNPKIKVVVIDTLSRVISDFIMDNAFRLEKGFEKWSRMSSSIYDIVNIINDRMRDDIIVYVLAHPETHYDEGGFTTERIGVSGKQLEKFVLESFSSIVLYAEVIKTPGKDNEHVFRTVNNNDTCKTPIEMFDDKVIPNDLEAVSTAIRDYYNI